MSDPTAAARPAPEAQRATADTREFPMPDQAAGIDWTYWSHRILQNHSDMPRVGLNAFIVGMITAERTGETDAEIADVVRGIRAALREINAR